MEGVNAKEDVKKILGSDLIETLDQLYHQAERSYFEYILKDQYKELLPLLGFTMMKTTLQGQ